MSSAIPLLQKKCHCCVSASLMLAVFVAIAGCGDGDAKSAATADSATKYEGAVPITEVDQDAIGKTDSVEMHHAAANVDEYRAMAAAYGAGASLKLDFAHSAVTDDELKAMAFPESVTEIDLSYTSVTDAGLKNLVGAKNLKRINLSGTKITGAAVETLKQFPKLTYVTLHEGEIPRRAKLELLRFLAPRVGEEHARRGGGPVSFRDAP